MSHHNEEHTAVPAFTELMPAADILETAENVTMWFEVPGASASNVDIQVQDGVLSITAHSALRRKERPVVYKRQFQLADGINVEAITASTRDGVLTLTIPKAEQAKVHKIKVN